MRGRKVSGLKPLVLVAVRETQALSFEVFQKLREKLPDSRGRLEFLQHLLDVFFSGLDDRGEVNALDPLRFLLLVVLLPVPVPHLLDHLGGDLRDCDPVEVFTLQLLNPFI